MNEKQIKCSHQEFAAHVGVARLEDTGRFVAEVKVKCVRCDLPFSFKGFPAGCLTDSPAVSADATELRCPIYPGPQPIPNSFKFEMPPKTDAN